MSSRVLVASLLSLSRMGLITVDRLDLDPVQYRGVAGDTPATEAAEWMSQASLETSEIEASETS
jgi:hypothetical protein